MSRLVVRGSSVTPESAGWRYVGFETRRLRRGERIDEPTGERELCAVLLSGTADVGEWGGVGGRSSVFGGTTDAVYMPPHERLQAEATSDVCEIALCWSPAKKGATWPC